MKAAVAWLWLWLSAWPFLVSAQTLTLEGQATFQTSGNTVVLTVDRIRYSCPSGVSGSSGSIRIELWATSSPFSGSGAITGYRTASHQLSGFLSCGQSYVNVSSGTIAYTPPPAGFSNYTLLLSQFTSSGWVWVDYINFSGSGGNGGLVNVSCTNNVVTMKFWDSATQDNDIVTVRLNGQTLVSNFDMNQCGGPSEPSSGPCVFTRTLPANSAVPLEITAINEGTVSPNTAALKVIGGCTPEFQEWGLNAGQSGQITINTGQGGGVSSYALQVTRMGTGAGSISSSPSGISCGSNCSANFGAGTSVTLTAAASSGSVFSGWSGDCAGTQSTCTVSMSQARNVGATFSPQASGPYSLTISRTGTGSGTVTSNPTGINCGGSCAANFSAGTSVTLSAVATSGSIFAGWSGDCTGTQNTCTVSMSQSRNVTAVFDAFSPGGGTVLQNGLAVNGSTNSTAQYSDFRDYVVTIPTGTTQLTVATQNHTGDVDLFVRFGSVPSLSVYDCRSIEGGTSPDSCSFSAPVSGTWYIRVYGYQTGSLEYSITASWTSGGASTQSLVVSRAGTGTGSISSSPAGISCGSTCSANFAVGSSVTLTATPAGGSTFAGWSGDCVGTQSTCTVSMNQARNVTASFNSGSVGVPRDERSLSGFALPTPNPPNANCPAGFFIVLVGDGPGSGLTSGLYGTEILLDDPGTRILAGGLNFGGLFDVSQAGFAGFNIANSANEAQRINVSLTGNPASSPTGSIMVRVRIGLRTTTTSTTVFETVTSINPSVPYTASVDVTPGFYEATVTPLAGTALGSADGQFALSLTTSFVNRPGGGFQGGAVVGGYHALHPTQGASGSSGFAAFCLATPHTSSIRVLSMPSYGVLGARDMRLTVLDASQRVLISVPN